MGDPATDPDMDIGRYPQDPQARQPGERLGLWLARRCAGTDAPPQAGDELVGRGAHQAEPSDVPAEHGDDHHDQDHP